MKEKIKNLLCTNTPILIWGPPGVGKTATITHLANELGLPIEVVIASIREPSDFSGLPVVDGGEVIFAPPKWAKRLANAGKGILFLDEISTAPPTVQAALLRVILDKVVGDLELPPEVHIIAAANPPDIAAGGWDLAAPLANRVIHLEFKLNPQRWVEEFPSYWGHPPKIGIDEDKWSKARAIVAGFIYSRPHLLLQLPSSSEQMGKAWPSPRTWDFLSRVVAIGKKDIDISVFAGCVGEGAAIEFASFLKELDLPNPDEILQNPEKFRVPERGDIAYATLIAIVSAVQNHLTEQRWKVAWKVIDIAADTVPDIAVIAARPLARIRKDHLNLPLPAKTLEKLGNVLMEVE